jgi:FK506-binding nuclear protein
MRSWLLGVWGVLSIGLAGCDTSELQIVPVAPPGAVIPREDPNEEVAEAQGEAINASARNIERGEAEVAATPTPVGQSMTPEGGLNYTTITAGEGEELKPGRIGVLNYVGKLDDDTVFDSNKKLGKPAEFTFGTGQLIKGWEMGVPGMKVGEVRQLIVPPALGYKDQDKPGIPPNSTLHFEIELVGVK